MTHAKPALLFFLIALLSAIALAQNKPMDQSVAGLRLGDRGSGKAFLSDFSPRMTEGPQPRYYFYNKNADTVMKVTAASAEDRYFITDIEVYAVDNTYRSRHYQLEKIAHFTTESGIFIGWKQSGKGIAATLIIGVPYPLGVSSVEPKTVITRFGEPTSRNKDKKAETLDYRRDTASGVQTAHYEFRKGRLERFSIGLTPKQIP